MFAREPALLLGVVEALLALAVSFGLDLSGEQVGGIMAVAAAIFAMLTRQSVYSPKTVNSEFTDGHPVAPQK